MRSRLRERGLPSMGIARALTIAGSDSGGGAGIQADLKTFTVLGVYGMSAITAVTVQNTVGVHGIYNLPAEAVVAQIDAVISDIGVDAVKTGMLSQVPIIQAVAERIRHHQVDNFVIDPVMVAKGGARLLEEEAQHAIIRHLLPLAKVVTPNLPEAEVLTGLSIRSMDGMREAAKRIVGFGARSVVIKGGHLEGDAIDLVYDGDQFVEMAAPRIVTPHTHGTGCTFSAAITAELAKGKTVREAVALAKEFITCAIQDTLGLGHGHGPTNHWAYGKRRTAER
jgi:hydroxymethylpyrimidine/phosphomethylpyrimidine kinase